MSYPTTPLDEADPVPRLACVVLADVSGSMSGAPIAALQKGFATFVERLTEDDLTRERAEVAVITFGSKARVAVPLRDAGALEPIPFSASGSTNTADAVNAAIDVIDARTREYRASGIRYHRPWLVLLTDGTPNPRGFDAAVARLNALETAKGVEVFTVGVGDNVDFGQLARVSTRRRPVPLTGLRFDAFFEWLAASLGTAVSSDDHGHSDEQQARDSGQDATAPLDWATA